MKKVFILLRRILKAKSGFTLSETLVTVLILLMVSAIVAGGVPSAANAYYKVIDAANAQLLLSETVMKLRSELAVATNVTIKEGSEGSSKEVETYTSGNSGWTKKLKNSGDGIKVEESSTIGAKSRTEQFLVPSKMSGAVQRGTALIASYGTITYDDSKGIFTVTDLTVKKGDNVLGKIDSFTIRNIIPKFSEEEKG